jgi:maltokinase
MTGLAPGDLADVVAQVQGRLGPFLARQRWCPIAPEDHVEVVEADVVRGEWPALVWLVVRAGGVSYQVLVGLRPVAEALERLGLGERSTIGVAAASGVELMAYDAVVDSDLGVLLVVLASAGAEHPSAARPLGLEQSNSSIVADERLLLKVYRRLEDGPNVEVVVTEALDRVGFNHLAAPLGVWRRDGRDLALLQEYLPGASDGWELALASVRDLYDRPSTPEEAGADFGSEARRLGEVTARLHLALAEAFGSEPLAVSMVLTEVQRELDRLAAIGEGVPEAVRGRLRGLEERAAEGLGRAIRIHGDFHLGQVVRADLGWFVVDFEGEPLLHGGERAARSSPLKDVAGMLRSLQYATAAALPEEMAETEALRLMVLGEAWEQRNRESFLRGYLSTPSIEQLLADRETRNELIWAYELTKAAYEVVYEHGHRPAWEAIPRRALARLALPD